MPVKDITKDEDSVAGKPFESKSFREILREDQETQRELDKKAKTRGRHLEYENSEQYRKREKRHYK